MDDSEAEPVLAKIRQAIVVSAFHPAPLRPLFEPDGRRPAVPMAELIGRVEERLEVPIPPWLREVYLACNGFSGPYGTCILYPLDGSEGVCEFTLFLREQDRSPPWLRRAIVFGYVGGSGSTTSHAIALDGHLIEWCYGDGDSFTLLDGDVFELWRRIQAGWDHPG